MWKNCLNEKNSIVNKKIEILTLMLDYRKEVRKILSAIQLSPASKTIVKKALRSLGKKMTKTSSDNGT